MSGKRKSGGESSARTFGRLVNNFSFGEKAGKHGEHFIGFCIDRLSTIDHRSKRFVMCDLMLAGLESSSNYSCYLEQLKKEFEAEQASAQV